MFLSKIIGTCGEVHAFEPDPVNFSRLEKSVLHKNNVFTNCKAVADINGKIDLYISDDLNVDHRTYPVTNRHRSIPVNCITIDTYLNGRSIDLIKMDIQGFEFAALKGMELTMKANTTLVLMMELWPYGLLMAGSSVGDVVELLKKNGFQLSLIINKKRVDYTESVLRRDEHSYYTLNADKCNNLESL